MILLIAISSSSLKSFSLYDKHSIYDSYVYQQTYKYLQQAATFCKVVIYPVSFVSYQGYGDWVKIFITFMLKITLSNINC